MTEFADGEKALALKKEFLHLKAEARRKVCDVCLSPVWPAWNLTRWQLRCKEGFQPDPISSKNQMARREGMSIRRYDSQIPEVMNQGGAITTMPEQRPMTIEEFDERQALVKHVVGKMEKQVHYGVIPGTRDNSLWEPGAEYLRAAFNIQWGYELVEQREDTATHDYYYQFFVFQLLGPGVRGPGWEASAWSKERKFFCKGGRDGCPTDCAQDHWPSMEAQMLPHNVRDRALKRAFVAMIRNVTGTTGYFKQALDAPPDTFDQNEPIGDGTDHPFLQTCPTHNKPWRKTGNMREPAHKEGDAWCNQSVVLKPRLDAMLKEVTADSWEEREINPWLRAHYEGTWSQLSPRRKLEAIDAIKSTPPPSAEEAAEPAIPVDPETGEIQEPQMDGLGERATDH